MNAGAPDEATNGTYRARADLGFAVRIAATQVLLVVAYYQLPLDRSLTVGSGLLFAGVLVLLVLVLIAEVRGILASPRPLLRAIRTIAIGVPMLLVVFASAYCVVDGQQTDAFSEPLNRTDGLYFTLTTFATVGYGDISPQSELARVLVMLQMIVNLLVAGVIIKVVLGAVRVAKDRNSTPVRASEP